MEQTVTYIFLCYSDYISRIVRGILCLLSGGLKLPTSTLCFVFIGRPDEQVLNDITSYQNAYNEFSEKDTLFAQRVSAPIILNNNNLCQNDYKLLFHATNQEFALRKVISNLTEFNFEEVKQNDRIVAFSQLSAQESLFVWKWIKNFAKTDFVQHVCEYSYCNNDELEESYRFLLDKYVNLNFTLITGFHKDVYKIGMTQVQSIEAILLNSSKVLCGKPVAMNEKDRMSFSQRNLSSARFSASICRMELLRQFNCWYQEKNKNIAEWVKNMNVETGDLWEKGKSFKTLKMMLSIYEKWLKDIQPDHFQVLLDASDISNFSKCLNREKSKLKGLREDEIRKIRMNSIIKALVKSTSDGVSDKIDSELWISNSDYSKMPFLPIIKLNDSSPFYPWELTDYSFNMNLIEDKEAKCLRSACLDFWETFFEQRKEELLKNYKVEEIRINNIANNERCILETTSVGKQLISEQVIFFIYPINDVSLSAITSPFTGFAIIDVDKTLEDKSKVLDLGERSLEFQTFIYNYIRCIGGFSDNFFNYILQQVKREIQYKEEGRGSNLFRLYPQFRKHIPLNITQKRREI